MLKIAKRPYGRSLAFRVLIGVAITYIAVVQLRMTLSKPGNAQWSNITGFWKGGSADTNGCGGFSFNDRLIVTIKTGATEAAEKIPVQLETTLRCVPPGNLLWYSDMAQRIGGHELVDALDETSASVKDDNLDFDIYRKQQELMDPARVFSELKGMPHPAYDDELAAWGLDKYKNIHIVEKSWAAKPNADWYLHIDADTYILWPSLMAWLAKLDPSKRSYMGSMACVKDLPFAHGGSGILLSKAATESLVVETNGTAARWDPHIVKFCCGDAVLALALQEQKIRVQNSWPSVNGEPPSTIPFQAESWCLPLVTLHHVSPADAVQLRAFEDQRRNKSAPVLYSELFADLVWDLIPDSLDDWDNRSNTVAVPEIHSAEECAKACERADHCLQSLFNGTACTLGIGKIVLGQKHEGGDDEVKWHSTWNKTRIAAWAKERGECGMVRFPFEDGKTSARSKSRCPDEQWMDGDPGIVSR